MANRRNSFTRAPEQWCFKRHAQILKTGKKVAVRRPPPSGGAAQLLQTAHKFLELPSRAPKPSLAPFPGRNFHGTSELPSFLDSPTQKNSRSKDGIAQGSPVATGKVVGVRTERQPRTPPPPRFSGGIRQAEDDGAMHDPQVATTGFSFCEPRSRCKRESGYIYVPRY